MKHQRMSHSEIRKTNRDQLLAAARQVFANIGYEAATIRDIVRASGLAQGSFYNYYKTKEIIFQEVVEGIVEPLIPQLVLLRARAKTPRAFLYDAYDACRQLPIREPEAAEIIARNQSAFRELFYLGDGQIRIKADLVADLLHWQDTSDFTEHDAGLMADAMIALGIDLIVQVAQNPERGEQRVSFLTELFLKGLNASA